MPLLDFDSLHHTGPRPGEPGYDEYIAEDRGFTIIVTSWVFLALATLVVVLRLLLRLRVYKYLLADDYWILAATVFGYISAVFTTLAVHYGVGRHMVALGPAQQEALTFWMAIAFLPGAFFFMLPKMAVITLLTRLMKPRPLHKWFLWAITLWSMASVIVLMGLFIGRCDPPEALWNFDMTPTCLDPRPIVAYAIYANGFAAFVDVVLAVYPVAKLFQIQMSARRRFGLSCALGIGAVGGAVAVYKTTVIPEGISSPDYSYDSAELILWTAIQGCTMMIAASMPVLAPLVNIIFLRHTRNSTRPNDKSYNNIDYSHEMGVRHLRTPESQDNILRTSTKEGGVQITQNGITAGPGQILVSNEISVTVETGQPIMDPLEALIRGYNWEGRL
ncbi:hypothetical protein B0I35DRAFT_221831 [Stachybotrys elegans]|uniref:Rhodopsin domain-containing protein n=1 Tax=Stachybotrys elegans TaxID=80388 RepID=A0A8K0WRD1_9HYPO|nr:hypothetical protein B0I35DRAFT_221831 [Stachybotrys elegans]